LRRSAARRRRLDVRDAYVVDAETLTTATAQNLSASKYTRAFIYALLGIEDWALY